MNIDRNKLVEVTNRKASYTGYVIEDYTIQGGKITRSFQPGETKTVTLGELLSLKASNGGEALLKNYLIIKDQEVLQILNDNEEVEPEYFYDDDKIKAILLTGTMAELEDCINFAPEGVKDRIKQIAVQIQLPDMNKREFLKEKLDFSVDNAIRINSALNDNGETPVVEKPKKKTRKAKTPTINNDYQVPQYEIVEG